jgi:lysophospholipase L1-like esterase
VLIGAIGHFAKEMRAHLGQTRAAMRVLMACCVLVAAGVSAASATARVLPILVMGDSYSAGNGAGDYFGAKGCWRSHNDYAAVFARALQSAPYDQPTVLENAACSGDTTAAFSHRTQGRQPQLDSVNKGYGIIFLTVGGDDIDFTEIVQNCLIQATRDGTECSALLSQAENLLKGGELEKRLSSVLDLIHSKANSHAKIVLLGYPYIEGDENYRLPYAHGKSIDVPERLRAIGDLGDQVQQDAVDALDAKYHTSNLVFVKTKALFAGHELLALSLNPDRWFVAPETDAGLAWRAWWYHPDPTGWTQEAQLLLADPAVPKTNPIPPPKAIPPGGDGDITLAGDVGSLRMRQSTRADVIRFAGTPESERQSRIYGVDELGYGCALSSGYELCDTTFFTGLRSGRLLEFSTSSPRYTVLGRIKVGMPTGKAARISHVSATGGCLDSIRLGPSRAHMLLTIAISGGHDEPSRRLPNGASAIYVTGGHVASMVLDAGSDAIDCA